MSYISLRAIGKTAAAICLAVAMSGVAMAGDAPDRVVMQSPAKEEHHQDGKIIIPPSGL